MVLRPAAAPATQSLGTFAVPAKGLPAIQVLVPAATVIGSPRLAPASQGTVMVGHLIRPLVGGDAAVRTPISGSTQRMPDRRSAASSS
jgi:hypothetical protein